jgi:hypothetical protein
MERYANIPERYRGPWCDMEIAEIVRDPDADNMYPQEDEAQLREAWAEALLEGDLNSAHKLWGKWQGYSGNDPWEDPGWKTFWDTQNFGHTLWDDFDASETDEKLLLKTFISYWDKASKLTGSSGA